MRESILRRNDFNNDCLFSTISKLLECFHRNEISDFEFVACYIISFIRHRRGGPLMNWIGGTLNPPILSNENFQYPRKDTIAISFFKTDLDCMPSSESNWNIRGCVLTDSERSRIFKVTKRRFQSNVDCLVPSTTSLPLSNENQKNVMVSPIFIFQNFTLKGVPLYVNHCLVNWAAGRRPFHLQFELPSPNEVLIMQCQGFRCLTVFVNQQDLNKQFKDPYPPYEVRDVLSFLFHDLQHMERFADPLYYCEQVGFLNFVKKISVDQAPFAQFDEQFKKDFEHLISDMNACCIHMFGFFKSKWKMAKWRLIHHCKDLAASEQSFLTDEAQDEFNNEFEQLMISLGLPECIRKASRHLCQQGFFCEEDGMAVRDYFHSYGKELLGGLNFPLLHGNWTSESNNKQKQFKSLKKTSSSISSSPLL